MVPTWEGQRDCSAGVLLSEEDGDAVPGGWLLPVNRNPQGRIPCGVL